LDSVRISHLLGRAWTESQVRRRNQSTFRSALAYGSWLAEDLQRVIRVKCKYNF